MSEDIPYGPNRNPWRQTLSNLAVKPDGTLMVTPPSQDPAEIYANPDKERGITPYYYQVPSGGLSASHARRAQDETYSVIETQATNHLGYQCTFGNDYSIASRYSQVLLNNIGDPYVAGGYTINTKWMERNVLDYYASLWNAKWPHDDEDPDTYWGYVSTMGSSEGNLYGIWNGRDYLQGKFMMTDASESVPTTYYVQARPTSGHENAFIPVAFYSQDSHYSLAKSTTALEIKTFYELGNELYPNDNPLPGGGPWPSEVPSEGGDLGPGSIDIDALITLAEFFAKKGHPPLVILNYGTTFKGAHDDVQTAGERLVKMLETYGLDERWIEVRDPNNPTEPVRVLRKGYWIHVDGALGAAYAPFIHMSNNQGRTNVESPPVFDFRLPFVCSICTSGHKFPGAPWPLGIYMTKTGLQLLPPTTPEYIGSPDTTFAGSRNGLSALIWWTHLTDYDYEAQVDKVVYCLDMIKYAYDELQKVQTEIGKDIWITYTPLTLTLQFMEPNEDIVHKYTLSVEKYYLGEGIRSCVHMYAMGHTKKATIDSLMQDLRSDDAFPPQETRATARNLKRRVRKAAPVERRIKDLHDGMIVGKVDQGLRKGVIRLQRWPTEGRGFF